MPNWKGRWSGGRKYETETGDTVWLIERRVNGRQQTLKLRVTSDRAADGELALFERDPLAYLADHAKRRNVQVTNLALTEDLIADFKANLERLGRSKKYVVDTENYLESWRERLGRADLRRLTLHDLQSHLKHLDAPRKCVIALKSCLTYAVSQGLIEPDENPGRFLKVEASQRSERPKGYDKATIEATYAALNKPAQLGRRSYSAEVAQAVRDAYRLAAETGAHYTEIERIAKGETAGTSTRLVDGKADAQIAAAVSFVHKTSARRGVSHVISLSPAAYRAVLRLQARGSAPVESHMREYLGAARAALKAKKRLRLGELRHSFTSLAKVHGRWVSVANAGVSLEQIATVLGHSSPATTKKHYDHSDTPPRIDLGFNLVHKDDPPMKDLEQVAA